MARREEIVKTKMMSENKKIKRLGEKIVLKEMNLKLMTEATQQRISSHFRSIFEIVLPRSLNIK